MHVIDVRNVHQALAHGVDYLKTRGYHRESRNGPVIVAPTRVTTHYRNPLERIVFWPERDANPFLHLYESLWMLAGRQDVRPLLRYTKQFAEYSDDGETLHGAYGHRWRHGWDPIDQLRDISNILIKNRDDRRAVLQMWDTQADLGQPFKDVPCNLMATFQTDQEGRLDMTVFCRSNDIIWGAYGANAVHFAFLLEYMAKWIGVPVGTYEQVSVNYHAYFKTIGNSALIPNIAFDPAYQVEGKMFDPYTTGEVIPLLMPEDLGVHHLDSFINILLQHADSGFKNGRTPAVDEWFDTIYWMLFAHEQWRTFDGRQKYEAALESLNHCNPRIDFVKNAIQWLHRRFAKWSDANS